MTDSSLEAYLQEVRPDAHDTVRALNAAIVAPGGELDCKIAWKMLVFTREVRWRQWPVAIGVSKSVVNLRFLRAELLDDPAGILRPGSSTAASVDYAAVGEVDAATITTDVREAMAKHQSTA